MKQTKHALSIFLCLLMLFSCMVPAFAETPAQDAVFIDAAEPVAQYLNVEEPANITPTIDWDHFFDDLFTFFMEGGDQTSLDVSAYKIPYTTANKTYIYRYCDTNPIFVGARPTTVTISGPIDQPGSMLLRINNEGEKRTEPAENKAKYEACLDAIQQLTYGIKDNNALSDYEKCLLLHDRLATWVEYDLVRLENNTVPPESFTAVGALVNRIGVCDSYARAYGWMLDTLGIENYYTASDAMVHAWNIVVLDGEPYFVDVTHDDPTKDVPGRVQHKNFMISSATYKTTSDKHNGNDIDMRAVSTNYENAFDKNIETQIVYLNGKFWYIDASSNQLMKSDSNGANAVSVKQLESRQPVAAGTYPYFPKMTAIGNDIIYINGKKVHAYNTLTGADTIAFTPNESIFEDQYAYLFGLKQVDGTIYVTACATPNFQYDTVANYTDSFVYCSHPKKVTLEKTVGPDCKTAGDLKEICKDCRAMFKTPGGGDKGEHNYQATGTTAATCTAQGYTTYTCTACGDSYNADYTAMLPHDWEWVTDTPATCGTAGSKHEKCKNCTATRSENTVIPATGSHSYTAQTVKADALKSAATCTAPATYYYSCATCGAIEKNAGHTFTSGSPAAHSYIAQTVKADALKSAATCTSAAVYYYSCVNCGKVEKNDSHTFMSGSASEHVWEWVIDKNATCVAAGSKHEKCKNCTATRSENTVIPATGSHSYTAQTVKADALKSAATCTAPATYYYSCATCGAIEKNAGHTFTSGSATAHVDANGDNRCDNCNKDLSQPQPEPQNLCKYCHKEHTGFFGKIVQFFHNILYSLTHLFKK